MKKLNYIKLFESFVGDDFKYNKKTKEITIKYQDYGSDGRNYGELFNWLGDFDVIKANELGDNIILFSGNVYSFTNQDEGKLKRDGIVTLVYEDSIEDYKESNPDFYNWYQNN